MPCPHNEISIVQRSHRQSAVAAAAYQSGEKLFCEYDQQVKHYPEKRGIVHNEILLPANAPLEYTDRNTLWNAAEAVEKQWNSQLARRWVLSIPREIPPDQYAALVRDFCRQQFVSKGMCVDFAIHVYFMGSDPSSCCKKAGVSKIAFRGFHSLRRSFETVMVSRGVPIETVSQMMGHKSIIEDKPYITHDTHQISFVAMDFSDVPITNGFHFGHTESAGSLEGGAGA